MLDDRVVWKDGRFIPWKKAQVHLMSHSFGRGSAIFEVISCYSTDKGTVIFRLPDHIRRLFNSARMIYMKLPLTQRQFREAIIKTVARNRVGWGIVKLVCYYPAVEFESVPHDKRVSVAIVAIDFKRDFPMSKLGEDALPTAAISRWRKYHPDTVPVHCKAAANYLSPMLAKLEVQTRGFKTPILLDTKGYLAEGATEAFFFVKNGKIYTSPLDNILPSITRASVIKVARDLKIPLFEEKIRSSRILAADEAFFSSTVVKVWPVKKLEKRKLPAPGPISRNLIQAFDEICAGRSPRYRKWLTPAGKPASTRASGRRKG
jgi:branched-chain amino acid aminotransferase